MDTIAAVGAPRFRRHLRAEVGPAEVFLFSELGVTVLHGREMAALAALLDGRRDVDQIAAAHPGGLDATRVTALLDRLAAAGLVTAAPPGGSQEERSLAWWDACGADAGALAATRTSLTLVGSAAGTEVARRTAAVLAEASVPSRLVDAAELAAVDDAFDLGVVLCGDYLDPALEDVDAAHRAAGRPWLLAKVDGTHTWIGPVFRPGGSCWHCLSTRLWTHRQAEAVVQRDLGRCGPAPRPLVSTPAATGAATHLVALEASKWLAGVRHEGQEAVWILDTCSLAGRRHGLRRRPQCPACGDPGLVAARTIAPVRLRSAPKISTDGGGDRVMTAAAVLDAYRYLVSPVTGIVKQVVPDPQAPGFAHCYRSGANLSLRTSGLAALRSDLRAENGGKGLTAIDAEVGALCEGVERHSGTAQGDELRLRGTLASFGTRAVDPRSCLLFDERQHAARAGWNPQHGGFNQVPPAFDPDRELDWTPLWSLTNRRHRLLPTAMLYFGGGTDPALFADSNGSAAGGSLEDAVLQGLLELVERDAVAIWWYNRLFVPEVHLAAFPDPRLAAQVAQHAAIGRSLHVLDVTSDLGVPAAVAVSARTDDDTGARILLGFGAHLDPVTAVRRALAEVNQMLPTDATDPRRSDDVDWRRWACHATLVNQPYLRPDPAARPRRPGDWDHIPRPDVRDDVEALVDTLADHDLETLVLDQTRPDVGMPVVRVVVPGLRSMWARYAPGRLFDVPVRTGALRRATPYDELNPLPLFL